MPARLRFIQDGEGSYGRTSRFLRSGMLMQSHTCPARGKLVSCKLR